MYSQFCFHYQKHSEKKRATMHIPRKPGEQIEVDWAGDPAYNVDRDTEEMIPDNLKTGVEHSHWFTPKINETYHEMAEHYDTAVLPARVRAPKDKPGVE
ncbi:MAG: hypothetical protein AB7E31_02500 [Desulfitobacterium sp.]